MYVNHRVTLIIPALNEAETIGPLLSRVDRAIVDTVVVVDNGSKDATATRAAARGAIVLHEARRGYGSACLRGLREGPEADLIVFMDGDGSDDPSEIEALLLVLVRDGADLVIGSRVLGGAEPGALTPLQRFGSVLSSFLIRRLWGVHYTDLGPFRAIRRTALDRLEMADADFGWTVEMQVKAAQRGLRTAEIPVRRTVRKAGESKVSGTIVGSYRAGTRILGYVLAAKWNELVRR
jgi:glycosyltransferase involved in cell wall biosynthesis